MIDGSFMIRPESDAFFCKLPLEISPFAEPVLGYPSGYSAMDETIKEVKMELLEKKCVKELEILHNVDIQTEAVDLACSIVGRYYDAIMVKRGKTHSSIPDADMLKVEALWMLEKASLELKNDKDTELIRIHREGYLMFRNLVELSEFRKEKPDSEGLNYFSHLEKENEMLRHSWNEVVENYKSVLVWLKNPQRMAQLVKLRECVCQILNSEIGGDKIIPKLRDIHTLLNEYKGSIPAAIMQYRTVRPCMVAKIASPLTGVPTSWLLNSFRPPVVCLRDRLARKVVGQDHAIQRIANIMSRPQSSGNCRSPLASFLFLLGSWMRIEEFFESLVEELYDSKDRLIWFNLDMHLNGSSSSAADIRDKLNAIQEKIIEVVKSTPFCALLFQNVGACEYTIAFLENILKHGKLGDNQGKIYDLSNTLIIMTSTFYVGEKKRQALNCNCKYLEMDCKVAEDARTVSSMDLECESLLLHKKVLGSLWHIHELVDDVLVLNCLRPLDGEVIMRVQLRNEFDASRKKKQLILYPSEAIVDLIFRSYQHVIRKDGLESCLKKEIVPLIRRGIKKIQPNNMTTLHMDVLVGSKQVSYRTLEVDGALEAFKDSLSQWKTFYLKAKQCSTMVIKLITECFQLLSLMQNKNETDQVMIWLKDMKNVIDGIISYPVNSSKFLSEQHLVPPKIEAKAAYRVRDYKYGNIMEDLTVKLSSTPGEKYQLLNFIADDAISSSGLDELLSCHPKSFLFLGLTENSKVDLVKALSCHFGSDNACESIIQISMEEYTVRDSLMQFVDRIAMFVLDGSSGTDSSLSDCTQTSPYRVLMIDRVGEAHLSVFGALLSLLDHGALRNQEGKLVHFCKTTIIITSDKGNKEILAGLRGHAMGSIIKEENADQRTEKPFRFELLNRIDEIVMFDPLLEPQLEKFYRLPIKIEELLERRENLFALIDFLFVNLDAAPADKKKMCFELGVNVLALGIAESWIITVGYKRKFSVT